MSVAWGHDGDEEGCWSQVIKPLVGALLLACLIAGAPVVFGALWAAFSAVWRAWWGA